VACHIETEKAYEDAREGNSKRKLGPRKAQATDSFGELMETDFRDRKKRLKKESIQRLLRAQKT